MTKNELLNEYRTLCNKKGLFSELDGINGNSRKDDIENAIDCLKCSDEKLDEYLTIIKLKFPNTYNTIVNNGNYKTHRFNRLYVYNTARMILGH